MVVEVVIIVEVEVVVVIIVEVEVVVVLVKGSLVEKLPSYGDLKMQRVQYSNSSSSSA